MRSLLSLVVIGIKCLDENQGELSTTYKLLSDYNCLSLMLNYLI